MDYYVECPGEYLRDCIYVLRHPEVFRRLGEEPSFNEDEVKQTLREGYRDLDLRGVELECKVDEGFERVHDQTFRNYDYSQKLAKVLYRLSQFGMDEWKDSERQGYNREQIIDSIREDMFAGLCQHVTECAFCLGRYENILNDLVRRIIFEEKPEIVRMLGDSDDLSSDIFRYLRNSVDEKMLGIYAGGY